VIDCPFEIGKCVKNLFEEKNDKYTHTQIRTQRKTKMIPDDRDKADLELKRV
jgi:hypothetical protein